MNYLNINQFIFSKQNLCKSIALSAVRIVEVFLSNQVEVDKRVTLHSYHELTPCQHSNVLLRSPSGDTDIFLLLVWLLSDFKERLELNNGSGTSRKRTWIGNIDLSKSRQESLLGFTGNGYVSTFFKNGKATSWKTLIKHRRFEKTFSMLIVT